MSHKAQVRFCKSIKRKFPDYFCRKKVIDVGSMDINGNNRRFFYRCNYVGVDIVDGRNVNIVGVAHEVIHSIFYEMVFKDGKLILTPNVDTIISTEALEHDRYYKQTLEAMYYSLRPGGLLVITCAGVGREEHGTTDNNAWCSPGTNDYYKNITNEMFADILPAQLFDVYHLEQYNKGKDRDLQFFGIKKAA